jgi:hypothetical protein
MELDSLKDLWKNLDEQDLRPGKEEVPILSMLQKRSQSTITRLKRNLNRELAALLIIYTLTIWYIITYQRLYWELALLLFFVGTAFLFYYYRKNKLLKQMQCVACEVKSNLKRQLFTLEKYVRFYFIAGTILTPLAYFAAGIIILMDSPGHPSINDLPADGGVVAVSQIPIVNHITSNRFFFLFISIGVGLTISTYFVNRWLINKMYGQHIQKLKELLYQMEEVD